MVISQETKDAFGKLILATNQFGSYDLTVIMRTRGVSCALIPSDTGTHAHFRGVDWTSDESVAKLIPFVEEAYRRSTRLPKLLKFKHQMRLKAAVEKDQLPLRVLH